MLPMRWRDLLFKRLARFGPRPEPVANELTAQVAVDEASILKLLERRRDLLIQMADTYPSIINNGYRHVERAIYLTKTLGPEPAHCIVDVGAANGVISLKLAEAFPTATIYSFEPIRRTFETLQQGVKMQPRIITVNKALGDCQAEKTMHIAHRITSSSLFPIESQIGNPYFSEQLKYESDEKIVVSRLDDELSGGDQVHILKIDVQGYELEVLKGGRQTLSRTFLIVLEMQNHQFYTGAPGYFILDEYLRKSGFELYDIVPSIREEEKLLEWDSIYVNTGLLKRK